MSADFLDLFQTPPAQYRGMPFWAWNTKIDKADLERQILQFKEMGMGGFYIHPRVGLDTEYLGAEYMDCVSICTAIAKRNQMYCGLYDEDRWPSGYGGGYVTKQKEFRCKALLFTPWKQGERQYPPPVYDSRAAFSVQGNGSFLAAYQIALNQDGSLKSYYRCEEDSLPGDGYKLWYAYIETACDSPWFNNQAYVDTLNENAVKCFIDTTYEKYYENSGTEFGKVIPSIFTDEPQFLSKGFLGTAKNKQDVMLPFTGDFKDTFFAAYKRDILDGIPELIWELPDGKVSSVRYQYHEHLTKRFSESYSRQIGTWCDKHNIKLCGHMMEEPTLQSQTQALGEVMRSLREFAIPGVDMLCDAREYTTVKQAQSICRQYNKAGVLSELYGVTNWDFDFRKHKLQGDWQAALGVTNRVHHLSWMSMAGEAKRDFPATIGHQSPWYREYAKIEDHFARVNTAMTKGRPVVKVAMIHPVESMWILFGPAKETGLVRQELDEQFRQITELMLFHNIDFDYLSESLIPELWTGERFSSVDYEVIIVPGCRTIRSSTLKMLSEFKAGGKKVVFVGQTPGLVDAQEDERGKAFAQECRVIPFAVSPLMGELEAYRDIDIRYYGQKFLKKPNHKKNWDGERTDKYIYQMREIEDGRWLFIANARPMANPDRICKDDLVIRIRGIWNLVKYDTLSGAVIPVECHIDNGDTVFYDKLYDQDSLLIRLMPGEIERKAKVQKIIYGEEQSLFQQQVTVERQEPNVMLMDIAEYSMDGVEWKAKEEILRIDRSVRLRLGIPVREAAHAQPWLRAGAEDRSYSLYLKYEFVLESEFSGLLLGIEETECSELFLNGNQIIKEITGYYVDQAIKTIKLPTMPPGKNELIIKMDFSEKVNLEPIYLLGDFSVCLQGSRITLAQTEQTGAWCSLTKLGMPFYGGNAAYRTECYLEAGHYELSITKFRAPLLSITIDGICVGEIMLSPYNVSFDIEESGIHRLEILSFGNRCNTFGAVHDCDEKEIYFDSNAWRTVNEDWAYEYQLKESGILKAPVIRKVEKR